MGTLLRAVLAVLWLAPGVALAHAGSLEKEGCHKDRRPDRRPGGTYHCHKGVLAGESFASRDAMLKELHRRERQGRK